MNSTILHAGGGGFFLNSPSLSSPPFFFVSVQNFCASSLGANFNEDSPLLSKILPKHLSFFKLPRQDKKGIRGGGFFSFLFVFFFSFSFG